MSILTYTPQLLKKVGQKHIKYLIIYRIIMENTYTINIVEKSNHYKNAQQIMKTLYKQRFGSKKKILKQELSFWSSFVNKKYVLVIHNYSEEEMITLRKEIELVSEFKLEECGKYYKLLTFKKSLTKNFKKV